MRALFEKQGTVVFAEVLVMVDATIATFFSARAGFTQVSASFCFHWFLFAFCAHFLGAIS